MSGPATEPIAIVGMGCRFPRDVNSPGQLWELLLAESVVNSAIPDDRWADYWADPRHGAALANAVRYGSFLDDVTGFDAEFFGITPREAEVMDPQQRILLEVAWQALEDAGIVPSSLAGTDTGVYIGAVSDDYERRLLEDLPGIEAWTGIGTQMCGLSNRISHVLDLRGASLTVDTACSASLVALHLACRALRDGESGMALVGGVNLILGPGLTVMLQAAGALSPDGRCKSFDASADGYGRGEGAAVLVLKRLSDAERDGDRVHALVRGSALHQDGHTNGIMAPSEQAQVHLLRSAYRNAGLDPGSVGYVEAHGTGTPVGDPIEAGALGVVLGTTRDEPLLIGSIKSNIGHLEGAAGVAGVIKAALALQHGTIPPSVQCATPNPAIPWKAANLEVVRETVPWPTGRRVAGVSGYGYGGALAHVVLEAAPEAQEFTATDEKGPWVFTVSGATEPGLRANAGALADHLAKEQELAVTAVGHTLGERRAQLPHRATMVADSLSELSAVLRALAVGDEPARTARSSGQVPGGPVFVFSGHGAQWMGMGRGLLRSEPEFARTIDAIGPVFNREIGFTPRDVLERGDLAAVDVVQCVTFAVQVGLTNVWRHYGVRPAAVIGHSVGEIAAAVCAGALDLLDGATLVCRRSKLLREVAGTGAMALVNLPFDEAAKRFTGSELVAAIAASPQWTVVAGTPEAVAALGLPARRVDSDVAFHSPALDRLVPRMREAVQSLSHRQAEVPLYRTAVGALTGLTGPRAEPVDATGYWAGQLRAPVRFSEAVLAAIEDGHRAFVEISSHPVVAHSIEDCLDSGGVRDAVVTGSLRRGEPDRAALLTNLGVLHCHGIGVDFKAVFPQRALVDLPTNAWQHKSFWRAASLPAVHLKRHDVDEHTLLGELTTVASARPLQLWQTELAYDTRPYPGNHPVRGVEIVPAAVLLHTLYTAAQGSLAEVDLRAPVSLVATREVQVSAQDGELRLASRLLGGGEESWLTHTTANAAGAGAPSIVDISAWRRRCPRRRPADEVFRLLRSLDVPDMGFPWRVTELWQGSGVLFAVVDAPDATLAPVLDAALSLPTAVFAGKPALRMPAGIGRMVVHGHPTGTTAVFVQLAPDHESTVKVTVASLTGFPLVEFEELRFEVLAEEDALPTVRRTVVEPANVLDEVSRQVAAEARLPLDELSLTKPLVELGLDSVMSIAVRRRLERRYGVALPATLLWNHPSVIALADYLVAQLGSTTEGDPR